MLDDLKYIHQRDASDALGIAEKQPAELRYNFELRLPAGNYSNIVYAGMGGSALPGLFSGVWPGYKVPFDVVRNYDIPAYVNEKTLFIASSYSGNTEETLEALRQAQEKKASIAVIDDGGKLDQVAKQNNYPLIQLPSAGQPRYAVFYNLNALVNMLTNAGLLIGEGHAVQLAAAADFLQKAAQDWLPTVPTNSNPAKKLAMELAGKSVVVYGGPLMAPAAYKWKISVNENAKNVAWWNELPEFDHNELIGWSSHPIEKPYAVVELRSSLDRPRIQQRFEVAEKLLSGRRPAPHVITPAGATVLDQLLWASLFADFVTIYLALLNGVNPTPVDLVEKFKQELG